MNKQQIEQIIDVLAEKTDLCSAHKEPDLYCYLHICTKPVLIGDVLERMYKLWRAGKGFSIGIQRRHLLDLWAELGFTKSLQQIVEESRWEEKWCCSHEEGQEHQKKCMTKALKSPQARALFKFLRDIFLPS